MAASSRVHLLGSAVLLLAAGPCRADVEARIARCAASADPAERIACLENSLRELAGTAADAALPAPAAAAASRPSAGPEPAKAPAPEAPPDTAAPELGAEQVSARERSGDEAPAIVHATAVEFRFVGYRRLLARLDNGQVWRQLESDRVSVERGLRGAESFAVDMWQAPFGGYRMRILPLDRTIRVERLE